jgi:hypothetical protein
MDQDNDGLKEEVYDDRYVGEFRIDATGPMIIASSVPNVSSVPVESFQVTFNEEILSSSFTKKDISIDSPKGDMEVLAVTPIGMDSFQISLSDSMTFTNGTYRSVLKFIP